MRPMTKQQIFDHVARHLLTQRCRSGKLDFFDERESFVCLYRGENNCKCAAGALIADEDYDPSIEGKDASLPRVKKALIPTVGGKLSRGTDKLNLILDLQNLHDYTPVTDWPDKLFDLACLYKLKLNFLTLI